MTLEESLEAYITAKCLEEEPNPLRAQRELIAVLRNIETDPRFNNYNRKYPDYYADALSRTLEYFINNTCIATTSGESFHKLLVTKSSKIVVARLLKYLKCRIIDARIKEKSREESTLGWERNRVEAHVNHEASLSEMLAESIILVIEDGLDGELLADENIVKGKTRDGESYELTAHSYFLMRIRDHKNNTEIANLLNISSASLVPNRWKVLARKILIKAQNSVVDPNKREEDDNEN